MIANQNGCRYACGLDHVILEGYALAQHEGSVTIDRINGLHRRIAEQVALRAGPLTGKEICFLRKHLGLTPEELEELGSGGGPPPRAPRPPRRGPGGPPRGPRAPRRRN